jgi:predicted DNA binding CopG/RHH family protein
MKELIYHYFGLKFIKCHECETLKSFMEQEREDHKVILEEERRHNNLLLEEEKRVNKRLLDELIEALKPKPIPEAARPEMPQNMKIPMSLANMRRKLEYEDYVRSQQKINEQHTADLEKKLGISDEKVSVNEG